MTMVCGLDRHRRQITFDAVEVESGREWKSRLWQPDRERFRRWLRDDVAERANGSPVAIAVEGCTDWRYVVEEVLAAGFEAHLAEPADTKAARGRKRHAKTDRTDCRLLREPLVDGRLPRSWIPPTLVLEWRERVRLWSINADVGAAHPRRVVSARRVVAGELDSLGPHPRAARGPRTRGEPDGPAADPDGEAFLAAS